MLPQCFIMSILLGYLTLVASLSNREIDVSTPARVQDMKLTVDILTPTSSSPSHPASAADCPSLASLPTCQSLAWRARTAPRPTARCRLHGHWSWGFCTGGTPTPPLRVDLGPLDPSPPRSPSGPSSQSHNCSGYNEVFSHSWGCCTLDTPNLH